MRVEEVTHFCMNRHHHQFPAVQLRLPDYLEFPKEHIILIRRIANITKSTIPMGNMSSSSGNTSTPWRGPFNATGAIGSITSLLPSLPMATTTNSKKKKKKIRLI